MKKKYNLNSDDSIINWLKKLSGNENFHPNKFQISIMNAICQLIEEKELFKSDSSLKANSDSILKQTHLSLLKTELAEDIYLSKKNEEEFCFTEFVNDEKFFINSFSESWVFLKKEEIKKRSLQYAFQMLLGNSLFIDTVPFNKNNFYFVGHMMIECYKRNQIFSGNLILKLLKNINENIFFIENAKEHLILIRNTNGIWSGMKEADEEHLLLNHDCLVSILS